MTQRKNIYQNSSYLHDNKFLQLIEEVEEDMEVICELVFTDASMKKMQRSIAQRLLDIYKHKPKTYFNRKKIQKFTAIVEENHSGTESEAESLSLFAIPGKLKNKIKAMYQALINSKKNFAKWYRKFNFKKWYQELNFRESVMDSANSTIADHGWFSSVRLLLLRLNRFLTLVKAADPEISNPFALYVFALKLFGISYALSLLCDIAIILLETFIQPLYERDKNKSYLAQAWANFKAVMLEDGRIFRMLNDTVWLAINITGIVLSGGMALLVVPIINVIGFAFDFCNDTIASVIAYAKYSMLEELIAKVIAKQENEITFHNKNKDKLTKEEKDELGMLEVENRSLLQIKNQLSEKIRGNIGKGLSSVIFSLVGNKARIMFCTAMIVVGMFLVFFPPTSIPAATLIGSAIAIVFGTMGSRLFPLMWNFVADTGKDIFAYIKSSGKSVDAEARYKLKQSPSVLNTRNITENLYQPERRIINKNTGIGRPKHEKEIDLLRSQRSSSTDTGLQARMTFLNTAKPVTQPAYIGKSRTRSFSS